MLDNTVTNKWELIVLPKKSNILIESDLAQRERICGDGVTVRRVHWDGFYDKCAV